NAHLCFRNALRADLQVLGRAMKLHGHVQENLSHGLVGDCGPKPNGEDEGQHLETEIPKHVFAEGVHRLVPAAYPGIARCALKAWFSVQVFACDSCWQSRSRHITAEKVTQALA